MIISTVMPEKQLQLEYNIAKIKADPYNYTLTDRVLVYDVDTISEKYDILTKGIRTELYLANLLKLMPDGNYCFVSKIIISENGAEDDVPEYLEEVFDNNGGIGTFIKYNNLIINETPLLNDFLQKYPKTIPVSSIVKDLCNKGYLKTLEYCFTKCISKSSLVPNLFYLPTNLNSYSLNDLENLKFASEAVNKNIAPVLSEQFTCPTRVGNIAKDRIYTMAFVPKHKIYSEWTKYKDFTNDCYRLGLAYALAYGVEILYNLNKTTDEDIKELIEELLSIEYADSSYCSEVFYKVDDLGHIKINQEVIDCFDDNNEVRFDKIREFFDKNCPKLNKSICDNYDYYKMPVFFAEMIQNMHVYAYQNARVKHAIFLYKMAKDAGVLTPELFQQTINNHGDDSIFSGGEEAVSNELLNLDTVAVDDNTMESPEDLVENEKSVNDLAKSKAPQLNTMDALTKDLNDSMYEFDIQYVKNDISNKGAYFSIANNIKMLAHNLAKQIKEIRTYNTGGKQGGLLTGKLDKKNLWRYKTDPKIFYNNNYKIKEMDLAFGCVLDESGSMSGEKIKNGRIVMVLLHEVLTSLGINHSIIGHSGNAMYQSTIYKYYQFKEEPYFSLEKPYNLGTARARSCNCDSGALYYMQKVIKRVQNKDKIVIIFSDGQPTECTDLDLTNQIKAMEKDGIHVIGVGINFESIKDYYPDNANGKNLKEMVDIVVSILKRYVLEKKED